MAPKKIDAEDLSGLYSKFQSLPKSENWKVLFSYDEGRRQEIVRHLISGLAPLKSKSPSMLSSNPLISALHRYSESMRATALDQANPTKPKNRPFACFRELVFCSMCAVARITTKSEIVYDIMRSVYGSDACSERFRALIRGAKWANEAIYHLSRTKCGKRSWDIVYTIERQVDYFTRLSPIIRPDVLIAGLDEDFYPEESSETSVPLAIPSIIRKIFNYEVPLEDICETLGYPFSDYEKLELSDFEMFIAGSKKRKGTTPDNSSKRHRESPPASSEDDCSTTSTNLSSSTPPSSTIQSPANSEADGGLEENQTSTSTPMGSPPRNGIIQSSDDLMDVSVSETVSINSYPMSQNMTFDRSPPVNDISQQSTGVIGDSLSGQDLESESPYVTRSSSHLASPTSRQQDSNFESDGFTPATLQQCLLENQTYNDNSILPSNPDSFAVSSQIWDIPWQGNSNLPPSSLWEQVWSSGDDGNDRTQQQGSSDQPLLAASSQIWDVPVPPQDKAIVLQHGPSPSSYWDQVFGLGIDGSDRTQQQESSDQPLLAASSQIWDVPVPPQDKAIVLQHGPSPSSYWDQVFGLGIDGSDRTQQQGRSDQPLLDESAQFNGHDLLEGSLDPSPDQRQLCYQSNPSLRQYPPSIHSSLSSFPRNLDSRRRHPGCLHPMYQNHFQSAREAISVS
ncbi:hypothetical protein N7490_006846 [Penicillium lividum]|nr:hypothetical protein N7490_006846 [Penicillium lividum]